MPSDRTSFEQVIQQFPKTTAGRLGGGVFAQMANDQAFAESLKADPAYWAITGDGTQADLTPKAGFAVAGQNLRPVVTAFEGASVNLQTLDHSSPGIGAINWVPDRDQIIRRALSCTG